jgi:PKD repeat protein
VKNYSTPPTPSDADSSTFVNGKTIYWYSLNNFFNFNTVGIFPVRIIAYTSSSEGCGNEQQVDFNLEINNPPVANFNWVHNGCINQDVQFNDQTNSVKPAYRWWWDFGDPGSGANNVSTLKNPIHSFSAPGNYTVRFANITTAGCFSDTISKQVIVHPLPIANISGDITTCQNAPQPSVVFTGTAGTAPFTFKYKINNGAVQTLVTTAGNSVSLPVSTTTLGTFSYQLISVSDAAGTAGMFSKPTRHGNRTGKSLTLCQHFRGSNCLPKFRIPFDHFYRSWYGSTLHIYL